MEMEEMKLLLLLQRLKLCLSGKKKERREREREKRERERERMRERDRERDFITILLKQTKQTIKNNRPDGTLFGNQRTLRPPPLKIQKTWYEGLDKPGVVSSLSLLEERYVASSLFNTGRKLWGIDE